MPPGKRRVRRAALAALAIGAELVATACTGRLAEQETATTASEVPEAQVFSQLAPAGVRRLTNTEIVHTIGDVFLGGQDLVASPLQPVRVRGGFDTQPAAQGVNTPFVSALQQTAELASTAFVADAARLAGCDPSDSNCAPSFIERVGRRAFRRALSSDERAAYLGLVAQASADDGPAVAMGQVVEAMIQSPFFLYRTELGYEPASGQTLVALTPAETASAIAYFVLSSGPDDALLDAADANQLATPEARAAQVKRLLATPRAADGVWNFMAQWANLLPAENLSGTFSAANPNFTPAVAAAAVEEARLGFTQEILDGPASWQSLLVQRGSYLNGDLAALYGVSGPAKTQNFTFTAQDANTRSGFFTQAAFLASQSDPSDFSPVHFGFFVANQMLCNIIPPPPNNIPALPSDPNHPMTVREKYAAHLEMPACAACHLTFQPMGWAFEQYRAIGTYQPVQNGVSLGGDGALVGSDVDGPYIGARALAELLAKSAKAQACFVAKTYEYALGRPITQSATRTDVDAASISASTARFVASNTEIRDLMASVVESPAFILRDSSQLPRGQSP